MGSKASKITVGYKYFMGIFMGLFRGPVNEIVEIRVGDRTAWTGSITGTTSISINQPELFGGTKAEGGVQGRLEVYMGRPDQTVSGALKSMLGGGRQPEFRGVVTAYFDGMVCAMNPYPKAWKYKARRSTAGWTDGVWYEPKCLVKIDGYDAYGNVHQVHAMNPAHILYECQSNYEWGRGLPRDLIDDVSFRKAADTLYTEGFGMCMRWTRQDTLESFMQLVLDHIGGAMYVSKVTGKVTLKLIRMDYDYDTLPVMDMNSGLLSIEEATNASPAEMINEVIVEYHNPIIDEDQQVRVHNLAQIQNQGCLNSTTKSYKGLPTGKLALQVAQRDLRVASTNVRRFTLICDRRAWNIQPGDVFKVKDPKSRGLGEVAVRVGTVEDGTIDDGKIKIVGLQDQFTFQLNSFTQVEPPGSYQPDLKPAIARRIAYEMPYVDMVQQIPTGELNAVTPYESFVTTKAEKPTPMSAAYDLALKAAGEPSFVVRGNGDFGPFGVLTANLDYLDTTINLADMPVSMWANLTLPVAARIAKPVLAGQTTPQEIAEEFIRIDAVNGNQLTVVRGVMDTVPQRHNASDLLWVTTLEGGTDWKKYAATEDLDLKVLPWTLGGGRFPIADAPTDHVKMNFRWSRPYPPGRVVHTLLSAPAEVHWYIPAALTYTAAAGETPDAYTLKWAHRDRIAQSDVLVGHGEADIGPEPGTTYKITISLLDGTVVRTETGITGTSWTWPYQTAAADVNVEASTVDPVLAVIRLESVRDGRGSWEWYESRVSVYKKPPQYTYNASLMQFAVQPFNADSAGEIPVPDQGGPDVASLMHQAVQPSAYDEADSMSGPNVALLPHQVTQASDMIVPLDSNLIETPYIALARAGQPLDVHTVTSLVARSSDRTVDSYTLFTKTEAATSWNDQGVKQWTPWGMLAVGLGFFNDEIVLDSTSDKDGVPTGEAQPGDLLMVDNEIMVITAVGAKSFKVGRGAVDTIPAQHYSYSVVWFISTHGYSAEQFGPFDKAMVIVRPDSHTGDIPLNKIYPLQLLMKRRSERPYPPGLVMIGAQPFFNTASALGPNFDPYNNLEGKDVTLTWAHRNRVTQGVDAKDHFAVGITLEPGIKYRIRVGYSYRPQGADRSYFQLLSEVFTEDAGLTLRAADLQDWGRRAGYAQASGGYAFLSVTLNAVNPALQDSEGKMLANWQGYQMTIQAPSYPLPPGERPGGSGGDWTPPSGGGGGTTPPVDPDRPRPPTPGGDGGDETPTPPEPPEPPQPPVDPENPDTDPPKPPEPPVDPTNVPGWSLSWDHGWAVGLPDHRYVPDNGVKNAKEDSASV